MGGAHDAGHLHLVHETARTVVADAELTLYHGGAALLRGNDETRDFLKHRVEVVHIHIRRIAVGTLCLHVG